MCCASAVSMTLCAVSGDSGCQVYVLVLVLVSGDSGSGAESGCRLTGLCLSVLVVESGCQVWVPSLSAKSRCQVWVFWFGLKYRDREILLQTFIIIPVY